MKHALCTRNFLLILHRLAVQFLLACQTVA